MSGGKKTTTTSNQQQASTTTLPEWMTTAGQDLYNKAKTDAAANPAVAYTGQMTAGAAGNQTAASAAARANVGAGQQDLAAARAMTGAAANGQVGTVTADQFTPAAAAQYMSPYTQQVQQNTLAEMRRQNGIDNAATDDAIQAQGAFGGTRQAIVQSEAARNQQTAQQQYLDSSNAAAYGAAQSAFQADRAASMQAQTTNASNQGSMLDRMLTAGGQAAGIGDAASSLGARDIAALAETGATDQANTQAGLSAAYNEFLRMQAAPNEQNQNLMAILSGTPRNVSTTGTSTGTQTQKTSGSFLDTMMGLGQLGVSAYSAGMFSDRRLKRDIARIDELPNGLGVYRYGYVWDGPDEPARIGVMADEVEQLMPEALGPVVAGYATVNYDLIGGLL